MQQTKNNVKTTTNPTDISDFRLSEARMKEHIAKYIQEHKINDYTQLYKGIDHNFDKSYINVLDKNKYYFCSILDKNK